MKFKFTIMSFHFEHTIVRRQDWQKNNSKNKNRIFEKKKFQIFFIW
jgi:predicted glycosyltransferase involved in capsule biosynthesis